MRVLCTSISKYTVKPLYGLWLFQYRAYLLEGFVSFPVGDAIELEQHLVDAHVLS